MQIREYDTRYQEQVIQFLDKCLPESGRQLGRRLLSVALEEAEKRGFRKIYLDSLSSSKKAIALYEKNGFTKTERYNDNPAADVFMVLELGNQSEADQRNKI